MEAAGAHGRRKGRRRATSPAFVRVHRARYAAGGILAAGFHQLQRLGRDLDARRTHALGTRGFLRFDHRLGATRGLHQHQPGVRRQRQLDRRHLRHVARPGRRVRVASTGPASDAPGAVRPGHSAGAGARPGPVRSDRFARITGAGSTGAAGGRTTGAASGTGAGGRNVGAGSRPAPTRRAAAARVAGARRRCHGGRHRSTRASASTAESAAAAVGAPVPASDADAVIRSAPVSSAIAWVSAPLLDLAAGLGRARVALAATATPVATAAIAAFARLGRGLAAGCRMQQVGLERRGGLDRGRRGTRLARRLGAVALAVPRFARFPRLPRLARRPRRAFAARLTPSRGACGSRAGASPRGSLRWPWRFSPWRAAARLALAAFALVLALTAIAAVVAAVVVAAFAASFVATAVAAVVAAVLVARPVAVAPAAAVTLVAALAGAAARTRGRGRDRRLAAEPAQHLAQPARRRGAGVRGRDRCGARAPRRARARPGSARAATGVMPLTIASCRGSFASSLSCSAWSTSSGCWTRLNDARQRLALVEVVVAQALHRVVGRLEVPVRHQQHVDLEARLDRQHVGALLVEQERGDVDRHLRDDLRGVVLHRLLLQDAQDVQRRRFGAADVADAVAARAGDVRRLGERRAQPLARQLHQAEARDLAELDPRAVVPQRVLQALLDLALVLGALHVDEVDDDQPAQVAQAQLARDLVGGLGVGLERGFLDVAALGGARRS